MLTSERSATPGHSSLPRVSWMFPKAKMRVFFSLIIFSFTLATCQGDCLIVPKFEDGKVVTPKACIDPFDQTRHLLGSTWNTADCYRCVCQRRRILCCTRCGRVKRGPGCTAVLNLKTCEYTYQPDDPSNNCS